MSLFPFSFCIISRMKKILLSDFDNTLHFQDGFHEKDLEAVSSFQKEGNLFGICTGRSRNGTIVALDERIHCDFFINATGALITDGEGNVLYRKTVPLEKAEKLFETYGKRYPFLAFNTGFDFYSHAAYGEGVKQDFSTVSDLTEGICGISFLTENDLAARKICEEINADYKGYINAYQNGPFVDTEAYGCSKGNAVKELKNIYGFGKVAAIGDARNDLSMLEEASPSFSFNASEDYVKERVDVLVDSVAEAVDYLRKNG
jgi:hydroxymethylpyrimidine pyrophosphatase-like HAD family hydrolase